MNDRAIFEISDLTVDLYTEQVSVRAVDKASIAVMPGEILAIVGESGSGKTVLTLGPLGLLPEGVSVDIQGSAHCNGHSLLGQSEKVLAKLRGENFGVVFQDPMSALNPMQKIGPQLKRQAVRLQGVTPARGKEIAMGLIERTGIPDPNDRYYRFPHEMSGGMLQRAMIALALAGNPRVLIADEPTTALDATVQAQILQLIKDIQRSENIAVLLITHDIGVVASIADRIAVLYAGQVVECGDVLDVLVSPAHPYTKGLLASVPDLHSDHNIVSEGITGAPPDQIKLRAGCPFDQRCPVMIPRCGLSRPNMVSVTGGNRNHLAACHVTAAARGNS